MTTYTIDNENNITAHGAKQEADGAQGERFSSQQELADLAANWPANRLIEVWNGIPGLTPVKKFTDRKSAVGRIWNAIQSLNGGNPEQAATPAPKRANKAKPASKQPKKAKNAKNAAKAKPAKAAKGKRATARSQTA
jgi:hypothetical protein